MPIIGATELQPVNLLGSYVQGLEAGRANQLARAQTEIARRKEQREELMAQEDILSKRATRKKTEVETASAETDRQIKNAQFLADFLGTANDQRGWSQLLDQAKSSGIDVSKVPQQFDPLYRDTMRDGFLGYGKFLENQRQIRTVAVQEGQLEQSAERLKFDKDKENWARNNPGFEIQNTPQGLLAINKRTGAVKPIIHNGAVVSGTAGTGDARVDEQNTAFNAKRLLNSANRIVSAINRNPDAKSAGVVEAVSKGVPWIGEGTAAVVRSGDRQIVEQNYEGVVDALLFLATGAAYNKEQREATINEIKPLFTDKPAALQDKKEKLLEYIQAAKIKSGRAWTPELEEAMQKVASLYGAGQGEKSSKAPVGVDQDVWNVMTPEERALWK